MIQFDCPKCLQQIKAHDQQAGQRIDCPSCATSLMVPAPSVGSFDDLFDSDEQVLDDVPAQGDVSTISAPERDESIDRAPTNKVQPSPIKQKTTRSAGRPQPVPAPKPVPKPTPVNEPSDVFEDLQFPEKIEQSHPAAVDGASESPHEDPFAVDPDKRLEVDGITDLTASPEAFSLKCPVCDSHLFVTTHVVGTEVKCTDCFSAITVPQPTQKQLDAAANSKRKPADVQELKSKDAPPVVDVDPSFGLAPVGQDLLAPLQRADDEADGGGSSNDELTLEAPTELLGNLNEFPAAAAASSGLPSNEGKSNLKSKPKSNFKDTGEDKIDPYRSRSSQIAKQKKRRKKKTSKPESPAGLDFPKFEFDQLFSAMVDLVTARTVAVRSIFAGLLLGAGNVVSHFAAGNFAEIRDPTMGDTALMWFWRAGVGWTLFGLGTIFLWYTAGVIFRKTAVGQRHIDSWRIGPSIEWTSTFLLIAFSFAVAGSPLMMFGATWLTAPLRLFGALPMLVSVWFTQSPFKIISVDAFSGYRKQRRQWKSVWLVVLALASIAFASGLMMAIPVPYLNILTSLMGAVVLSFVTLGYAAVAGWHSGKVVEELS